MFVVNTVTSATGSKDGQIRVNRDLNNGLAEYKVSLRCYLWVIVKIKSWPSILLRFKWLAFIELFRHISTFPVDGGAEHGM